MKKALIPFITALAVILSATAVSAVSLSPGLSVISAEMDMTVSAEKGETVTFTGDQFAKAVGAESYEKITVTALPESDEGTLYFGDVAVTVGQVIKSSSVSSLRFEPCENTTGASFGFDFDGAYAMTCNVVYTDKENKAPTALSAPTFSAFKNTEIKGELRAHDADGDSIIFEVVDYPEGGKLSFDSKTGEFTYKAGSRVMEDSFTYRAKDSLGNLSKICEYTVSITENETETVFSDIDESSAAVSAVAMTQNGYMSCVEDKGKLYFSPDSEVSRLDFLVTAMNVFGADKIPEAENTGFADDGEIGAKYKGYVYSAAKLGIISDSEGGKSLFRPGDCITKAEASVILNNIIGYEAKTVSSLDGVPEWAADAVCAMYELGVYDLENGKAASAEGLTKEAAADMLYKVYSLIGE